jgi:2-polyprenyl-3-methyl-5-hydroxy-6-metoxy-1,4-benzoquinol methylase
LLRHLPKGRVLEVGCAAGFFLKVLERRGYEVHGVEVSGTILAHARDVLKLAIRNGMYLVYEYIFAVDATHCRTWARL